MFGSALTINPASLPRPGDPARARLGRERWREQAGHCEDPDLAAFALAFADDAAGGALLEAVFGNSPFLGRCLLLDMASIPQLLTHGVDAVFRELVNGVHQAGPIEGDGKRLMQALRVARRRAALTIALADITGQWSLEQVTGALSAFADACIGAAVSHLLRRAGEAGDLNLPRPTEPARDSGLVILAMGKLGACELNYSSDIDLIVLYDRDKADYRGSRSLQDFFVRLARDLRRMREGPTAGGSACRTVLARRPGPAPPPRARSAIAAATYCDGMGKA